MAGKEEFNWHQQRRIYSSGHEHHPTALTSAPRRNTRATRIAMLLQKKEHSFEVSHFRLYPILSRLMNVQVVTSVSAVGKRM